MSNEKAITTSNMSAEVNFGILDCTGGKLLQGFEGFMSKIMLPAVKSQEVRNSIIIFPRIMYLFTRCLYLGFISRKTLHEDVKINQWKFHTAH